VDADAVDEPESNCEGISLVPKISESSSFASRIDRSEDPPPDVVAHIQRHCALAGILLGRRTAACFPSARAYLFILQASIDLKTYLLLR